MAEDKQMQEKQKAYNEYIKSVTPTHNVWLNMLKAFICGGAVCAAAEWIRTMFERSGMDRESAGAWTLLILIGTAILLTGFNLFGKIAKFAGAGVLVPITGFANSVVAPAIEYKKEGHVFGIGVKIFTISGPVILYGIVASFLLGVICLILKMCGIQIGGIS